MACILASRLAAKRFLEFNRNKLIFGIGSRYGCNKAKPPPCVQVIQQRPHETHDDKNARLGRPLAPHLSIYKPQTTSMLSIMHRITGTVGGLYLMVFAACALGLPYDFNEVCDYIDCLELPNYAVWMSRFVLSFPFVYHTVNGVRHLTWDTGNCLSMNQVFNTGMAMLTVVMVAMGAVIFVL